MAIPRELGMVRCSAAEHDATVALVSHLPHLAAIADSPQAARSALEEVRASREELS